MNVEKYNELTDEIIKVIDYEFFNKEEFIRHLEVKKEYSEYFKDDEIRRIKVVREAINRLPEPQLVKVFEELGIDVNDIPRMMRIYDKMFNLDEVLL